MSYQAVPVEIDLDAAVAAASDPASSINSADDAAARASVNGRLFRCFGKQLSAERPGLGLPTAVWTVLYRAIFATLVAAAFFTVPARRLASLWCASSAAPVLPCPVLSVYLPACQPLPPSTLAFPPRFMPFVGVGAATLANAVPVGGGIVFFPFLLASGLAGTFNAVAFGVATQMLGNGTFGLLGWLRKDPTRIAWYTLPYAVLPSFAGSLLALFGPPLLAGSALGGAGAPHSEAGVKRLFGLFALCVR